jgi:hypothetical protein
VVSSGDLEAMQASRPRGLGARHERASLILLPSAELEREVAMPQRGQVFMLKSTGRDGRPLWAYRYRRGGRGSKRPQRGGFATEEEARAALERALDGRQQRGPLTAITFAELCERYLAQHDVDPVTLAKLRWLLARSVAAFGGRHVVDLRSEELAAWRMNVPEGHRFEATQALRQVLRRAVVWGIIDENPAWSASRTRLAGARRCGPSSRGRSWRRWPPGSAPTTDR